MSSRKMPRTSCAPLFRRAASRPLLPSNPRFEGSGGMSERSGGDEALLAVEAGQAASGLRRRWSGPRRTAGPSPGVASQRDGFRRPLRELHGAPCGRGAGRPPKRRYGITEAERDDVIASRGGVRGVCLTAVPAHVDHCQEAGRVRGVLCFSCNAALGQFKVQPEVMRRAAAYVEGNAWKPTLVAPGVCQLPS
jgi:hypothetical protein